MTDIIITKAMLDCIPPDLPREPWVKIVMAVKSELGDSGFDLVDKWSQSAENYEARAVRDTYRSVKVNGGISIGTLIHYAKQYGYDGSLPSQPSMEELAERKRQAEQNELEKIELREQAAQKAAKVWQMAKLVGHDHPYLIKKQVTSTQTLREIALDDLKLIIGYHPQVKGEKLIGSILVVPFMVDGKISTVELIDEEGRKHALANGQKHGAFWASRRLGKEESQILIAEGMATAATAAEATGHLVIAVGDCHNLKKVAPIFQEQYPDATLTILADLGNGEECAEQAAILVNANLARPDFGPDRPDNATDFNDLAVLKGHAVVKEIINAASGQKKIVTESSLLALAEKLTPASSPDEINKILSEAQSLSAISVQRVQEGVKAATKLPLKILQAAQKQSNPVDDDAIDHLAIARATLLNIGLINILCNGPHIWLWEKVQGLWRIVDDRKIKQSIHASCEKLISGAVTGALVSGVLDVLKTEIFADAHQWNVNQESINVSNGELIHTPEGWQHSPHVRENYRTTQLPIKYDPNAKAPGFLQFLEDIFSGDVDALDKAQVILELIGYTMVSHALYEKFGLFIGNGANGKSVLLTVIRALIGPDNCSGVQPSQFSNQFQRAHLHHKLANIVSELKEGATLDDDALKAIVSGEVSTVAQKGKNPFDMEPYCTCLFGTNHMPHTNDFSDALFRRAIIVTFNRQFTGVNADPSLKKKLVTPEELSGILNLALHAYGAVLARGTFTEPNSSIQAKQEWRFETDQAAQFVADRVVWEPGISELSSDVFNAYTLWVAGNGIKKPLNKKNLTQRLEKLGAKPGKGTGGVRRIFGLRLLPPGNGVSGAWADVTHNNFNGSEAIGSPSERDKNQKIMPLAPLMSIDPHEEGDNAEYF